MKQLACNKKSENGFTIVELLIVIVVIAILAAISIVAYSGIQQRARHSEMMSDISSIKKAIELYRADEGVYPACSSGSDCLFRDNIRPMLVPEYVSVLPTYQFNYVRTGPDNWGMRIREDAPYSLSQPCKFGVNMTATWYSSAPECT